MKFKFSQIVFLTFSMMLVASGPASANDAKKRDNYLVRVGNKIQRSIANVALGPLEIVGQMEKSNERHYLESGGNTSVVDYAKGFPKGIVMTVGRACLGVFEAATFFIPNEPLLKPAYPLEAKNFDTRPYVRAMAAHPSFQEDDLVKEPVYH